VKAGARRRRLRAGARRLRAVRPSYERAERSAW